MSTYQTEAIVIRNQDFAESDILLTLFTQKHGKIKGILKSGRKSTNKLSGSCQFLNLIKISVYGKPQVDIHKITQAEIVKSHEKVRENLEKLSWASLYVEFLQRATGDHQHDQELFDLSTSYLQQLSSIRNTQTLTLTYLYHLLQVTGFSPLLSQCVKCRKIRTANKATSQKVLYFDPRKGGILCSVCYSKTTSQSGLFPINPFQLQFLDTISGKPMGDTSKPHLDITQGKELLELILAYARYQLEGDFKSVRFLKSLTLQ